ncbi:MAG TPA: ion channel [Gemmatimonadales bacterium]
MRPTASSDDTHDLGFGSVVTRESRLRLLNRDGSFNVRRTGLGFRESLSLYHTLLNVSWTRFLTWMVGFYLGLNVLFAAGFWLCGPDAINGPGLDPHTSRLLEAFFFSVQTFGTIGYGQMGPVGLAANVLVTAESLVGLMCVAIVTGLLFARFSKPRADILFSRHALVAPYHDGQALMFRLANRRKNQLIGVEARVLYSRARPADPTGAREFHELRLERSSVVFFPLSWTVVHALGGESPLAGVTPERLRAEDAEFLVLLSGTDETFFQQVHARTSYKPHELVWNARFTTVFLPGAPGEPLAIDIGRLHDHEPA